MFVRIENDYVEFILLSWTFHFFEELYKAEDLRNQTCEISTVGKNNTSKGFVELRDGAEKD